MTKPLIDLVFPKRGGRRNEIAASNGKQVGRPRKDNVKWFCYLDPGIVEMIDQERGKLTRGEFITLLMASRAIDRSNT